MNIFVTGNNNKVYINTSSEPDPDLFLNKIQLIFDTYAALVDSAVQKANLWLDNDAQSIGVFIAKLPLRLARNLFMLVYNIVKVVAYTLFHPWEAVKQVPAFVTNILCTLKDPKTLSQIGVGALGAAVGQLPFLTSPLLYASFAFGGAVLLTGLIWGTINAGLKGEAIQNEWLRHLAPMPESFLTGFVLGLIFGAIQGTRPEKVVPVKDLSVRGPAGAQGFPRWGHAFT